MDGPHPLATTLTGGIFGEKRVRKSLTQGTSCLDQSCPFLSNNVCPPSFLLKPHFQEVFCIFQAGEEMRGKGWARGGTSVFSASLRQSVQPRPLGFKHPLLEPSIRGSAHQFPGMKPILMPEPSFTSRA